MKRVNLKAHIDPCIVLFSSGAASAEKLQNTREVRQPDNILDLQKYQVSRLKTEKVVSSKKPDAPPGVDKKKEPDKPVKSVLSLNSKTKQFFNSFSGLTMFEPVVKGGEKQQARLIPTLNMYENYNGTTFWLEFSTGINKNYVVKNIGEYINCIALNKPCLFGKGYKNDPDIMEFEPVSKEIADLLIQISIDNKHLNSSSHYYYGSSRQDRKINLSNSRVIKFLEIMSKYDQGFEFVFGDLNRIKEGLDIFILMVVLRPDQGLRW